MAHEQDLRNKSPETLHPFPISGIIFDYDGLLVDTEDLWFQTFQQICAEYSFDLLEGHRAELLGQGSISAILINHFGIPESKEVLRQKMKVIFLEVSSAGIKPMPGAFDILDKLSAYPLAIGSSSSTDHITEALDRFGIRDKFNAIVGGDLEINGLQIRGKPNPDIYLESAKRIGVDPMACLVFEDSPRGIQAAKAAGMRCVAVPNKYLPQADYSQADLQLPTLQYVNLFTLQDLQQINPRKTQD